MTDEERDILYQRLGPDLVNSDPHVRYAANAIKYYCPSCKGKSPHGCNYCNSGGL